MVSDTDIAALLKRVADLERRVAELEGRGAKSAPRGFTEACPKCAGVMRLTDEKSHPIFGMAGLKIRTFTCDDCGKAVERDYDPPGG